MLCDADKQDDCTVLQINDAENYVRYHLVTLLENIRQSQTKNQLKTLILGCTHYPYLKKEIKTVLGELYDYQSKDGHYLYRDFMVKNIQLIDPAINTAQELYEHLATSELFNLDGNMKDSEFYISVANRENPHNILDEKGRFTYAYKYGRRAGVLQEYVKVVPFSRKYISNDILNRFQKQLPLVYELMQAFSVNNKKSEHILKAEKI
jgi:hypothetical protein